uniref:HAT C-terminal dimerisation domain-containing protein n=1 Tax=Arundo donax TaxID=35708 RepID=A0A0A9HII7_ARUDO
MNVMNQLTATVMSPEGVALNEWRFSQHVSREELVRMIVLHELPFSIVDYDGFRRFVSSLNPAFKMVSRRTVTLDCLKAFEEHKQVLRDSFKNATSRISLTMDMWTSNQTLCYMCITSHCIDDDWKMHKIILKFSFMKSPHMGVALFNAILKSIQDWNIEDKLFAITLDNATNNNAMVGLLKDNLLEKQMLLRKGKLLHQRCAAHVLNLICQAGIKILNPIVHKIRESVKYIQGSQSRKQKFEEIVQQLGITCGKHPKIDVATRWNSTYLMVESALEFKRAFESLRLQDAEYTYTPTLEEWEKAHLVSKLLKVFFDATKVISGSLYPTSNLHFHEIWEVKLALENEVSEVDADLFATIQKIKKKFNKYWNLTWLQISIPVLLDPRFKFQFIEFRLQQAFGSQAVSKIALVNKIFLELFKDYSQVNLCNQEATQQVNGVEVVAHASGRYADWDNHLSLNAHSTNEVPSELEAYLAKPLIPCCGKFNILAWWKSNSLEYPTLSRIARDILVVPTSTVAAESAFSTGGRLISDFRCRLTPETMEALVCLQDWMRASGSSKLRMENILAMVVEQADLTE